MAGPQWMMSHIHLFIVDPDGPSYDRPTIGRCR